MKEVIVSWNGSHWVAKTKEGRVSGRLDLVLESVKRDGLNPHIDFPSVDFFNR